MAANDFFARWSKADAAPQTPALTAGTQTDHDLDLAMSRQPVPVEGSAASTRLPDLQDALALRPDSDFVPFMARGVDESVKRLALKQLFADPHFNVMDGLDIYIGDYNTFVPMTAAMVAALNHGKALLDPLGHLLASTQGGGQVMAPTLAVTEPSTLATDAGHEPVELIAPTEPDKSTAPDKPSAPASATDTGAAVPVSFTPDAPPANRDVNDLPDL